MKRITVCILIIMGVVSASDALSATDDLNYPVKKHCATLYKPVLRVDGRVNPLGFDRFPAKVSWTIPVLLDSNGFDVRGQRQTAYELRMASSPEALSDEGPFLWQSGEITSSETLFVPLAPEFSWQSNKTYFWTVRIWDENGAASEWATPAWFTTGLLDPAAWGEAQWITSEANAASDDFVKTWERAALLDRASQKPDADENEVERWYGQVLEKLAKARSPVVFQKHFNLDSPIVSARLYISGLGYYHAQANGRRIGDHALAPSVSNYDIVSRYNVFDVTGLLKNGENRLDVTVAPGRLRETPAHHSEDFHYLEHPVLRVKLIVKHADGSSTVIASDESWQAGTGPVRRAAFWVGEAYDATKPFESHSPVSVAHHFSPRMRADDLPPQKRVRELDPVSVANPHPGVWVYDFGRMTVGKARVQLPPGKEITIRYGELRNEDINSRFTVAHAPFHMYPKGMDRKHPDILIAKFRGGAPAFVRTPPDKLLLWSYADHIRSSVDPLDYSASFDYTGFRYVEVTGIDQPLPDGAVKALEIHNPFAPVGNLEVDNPKLQAVADAAALTILLNTQGIYQDNPGAERVGGSSAIAALISPHAFYAFDNRLMMRKALEDAREAVEFAGAPATVTVTRRHTKRIADQIRQGRKPEQISVAAISDGFFNGKTLLDAIRFYGDNTMSRDALDNAAFYFECMLSDELPALGRFADHIDYSAVAGLPRLPGQRPTDPEFMDACALLWQGRDFLAAAQIAGRDDLINRVKSRLAFLREEIDKRFFDPASNRYGPGGSSRQGANLLTLLLGLLPETEYPALLNEIITDIENSKGRQTTGSRLTGPLFSLLAENGHINEAVRLTTRTEYPSPYAMLSVTGGTISEMWGTPDMPAGGSFVQSEGLAASVNWIYETLVGIKPSMEGPGFARFYLAPTIPDSIPECRFSFNSPRGLVESSWRQSGGAVEWLIRVPPNTTAQVSLPRGSVAEWREGDMLLSRATGIKIIDSSSFVCESGIYKFKLDPARGR